MTSRSGALKWRIQKNYSQEVVAAKLGITRSHYALWEQGRSNMSERYLAALDVLLKKKPINVNRLNEGAAVLHEAEKIQRKKYRRSSAT